MSRLIALNKPDSDGSVIPVSAGEGSAMFASTAGPHEMVNLVVSGGEYNVETATCCVTCICCYGVVSYALSPDPFICGYGTTYQLYGVETFSDGTHSNVPGNGWSSSDITIATVSNPGGLVTGVAAGTVTISAWVDAQDGGQVCEYQPSCTSSTLYASNSGTVCDFYFGTPGTTEIDLAPQRCDGLTLNSATIPATVEPSQSACPWVVSKSSCSTTGPTRSMSRAPPTG